MTTLVDEKTLYELIKRAVREAFEEYEFLSEDDWQDRQKAMKELSEGLAIDWDEYKGKRNLA